MRIPSRICERREHLDSFRELWRGFSTLTGVMPVVGVERKVEEASTSVVFAALPEDVKSVLNNSPCQWHGGELAHGDCVMRDVADGEAPYALFPVADSIRAAIAAATKSTMKVVEVVVIKNYDAFPSQKDTEAEASARTVVTSISEIREIAEIIEARGVSAREAKRILDSRGGDYAGSSGSGYGTNTDE